LNTHQKRELKKQRERLLEAGGAAIEQAQAQHAAGGYEDALDSLDVAEAAFREAVAISPTPQPDPLYNVGVVFMNRAENAEARAAANPAEVRARREHPTSQQCTWCPSIIVVVLFSI